jgi:hypothetical protein
MARSNRFARYQEAESSSLERVRIDRAENDWIQYWVEKQEFQIACGPMNLSEAIEIFVHWFESD